MRNVVGTNGSIIIIPCFIRWTRGRSTREGNAIHVRPTVKWIGNGGPLLLLQHTFFLKWATHCCTFTLVFRISGLKPISILDLQQQQPMSGLISLILHSYRPLDLVRTQVRRRQINRTVGWILFVMEIGNWVRGARLLICQEDVGGSEKFFARMKRRRVMMGINVIIVSRGVRRMERNECADLLLLFCLFTVLCTLALEWWCVGL